MELTQCFVHFNEYLSACGFAKNSKESYARTLQKFEKFLVFSDRSAEVQQLKKEDLIGFLAACEEAGEKRSSLILRLLILKKFFGWLKEERIIAEDPAAAIAVPKEERTPPNYVSIAQVEILLNQPEIATPSGLRDRALLEVIYSSGLRISEALDLEVRDIDSASGFVHVRNGKGGKARTVPIGKTALQWLQQYLESRKKLLSCSLELIFVNNAGERLSRQSAAAAIREYVKNAGLPAWITAHSLRHACASHMLEGGAKLPYIQEQLGHSCMESTRIYLSVRSADLKNVHSTCHPRN